MNAAMITDDDEAIDLQFETERTVLEITLRDRIAELIKDFQNEHATPLQHIVIELATVPLKRGTLRTFVQDIRVTFYRDKGRHK